MQPTIRVFVSSTWEDMREHRAQVLHALNILQTHAIGMEFFGAAPSTPVRECLRRLRDSQVFIGILGTRYGTRDGATGKSISHLEFDEAKRLNIPRLMFLLDTETHPVLPKYVDVGDDRESLLRLRQEALSTTCSFFHSPDHLAAQVVANVARFLENLGILSKQSVSVDLGGVAANPAPVAFDFYSFVQEYETNGRIADPVVGAALGAAIVASRLRKGDFDVLRDVISFRPDVLRVLLVLLEQGGIDDAALSTAIRQATDTFHLRLLIYIAGVLRTDACAESICLRLLDSSGHKALIHGTGLQIGSFNDVCKTALKACSPSVEPTVADYMNRAAAAGRWQAKRVLESAARALRSKKSRPRRQVPKRSVPPRSD